ncbi:hypothetical protein BJV74DRAFT_878194 [Russula compacta]|nr:hypothetical protein BJV74DRAFT_878194 [Russula compacta]
MVVVQSPPSTSSSKAPRKNRRTLSKRKAPPRVVVGALDDRDDEMNNNVPPPPPGPAERPPDDADNEILIDVDGADVVPPTAEAPTFGPAPASAGQTLRSEMRRVAIPLHRMSPLKRDWINIFGPLTEILGLQVRMNVQRKCVEIRTSKHTKELGALQKGADFVKAFALGFDVNDAIALLRLDDLYLDSFEIKDVKTLHGDHLSRAIGRIAGQDGKTKFTIENASRTRIILADTKIHILGSFQNIKIARDAIVSLILGSPPENRMKQRAL